MGLTQDEIYRQGLQALRDRLGRAGMIRFLQQFERGSGDYARERHDWVDRNVPVHSRPMVLRKKGTNWRS
jgi:hypothetical protein